MPFRNANLQINPLRYWKPTIYWPLKENYNLSKLYTKGLENYSKKPKKMFVEYLPFVNAGSVRSRDKLHMLKYLTSTHVFHCFGIAKVD